MARFAVTRTLTNTEVNCFCFDKQNAEPFNKTIYLAGTFKDENLLAKKAAKIIEQDPNVKFIEIAESYVHSGLYGCTEEQFLSVAVPLDPETRKPIE